MRNHKQMKTGPRSGRIIVLAFLFLCPILTLLSGPVQARSDKPLHLSTGQVVYVPAYTHVYYTDTGKAFPLTTTLIIHNTDPREKIEVTSVRFHDAEGVLIRNYAEKPFSLAPFAACDILVKDMGRIKGKGSGTCFVVTWQAEKLVSLPIIECIIIGATSQQGISFRTQGQVVQELP